MVAAAVYILNRTLTSRIIITPFKALYEFKLTINYMKVYSCKAYLLIYSILKL